MSQVLILGGTGAMGIHLVQLLVNKGIVTFVTSRKHRKSDGNLQYIQGNAHNIDFIKNILESNEWDSIVDFMTYNTQTFKERVDLLLNNTKQYIFLSSARVYADSEQSITENSPRLLDASEDNDYLATDEYALTKARQEDILKNSGYKNYTIIRPYITYSENRLQLGVLEKEDWLYRVLHGRTIVFSEDICKKITTLTYGYDVSNAIAELVGNINTQGEIFHITLSEQESCQWQNILDIYVGALERHLGYEPKVSLRSLNDFLNIHSGKYQILYDRLFDRYFDNSKIARYVEIDNFMNIKEGLNKCLEEFLKNPRFKQINWGKQARMDKLCNEKTSLFEIQGIKQKFEYLFFRYL